MTGGAQRRSAAGAGVLEVHNRNAGQPDPREHFIARHRPGEDRSAIGGRDLLPLNARVSKRGDNGLAPYLYDVLFAEAAERMKPYSYDVNFSHRPTLSFCGPSVTALNL